MTSDTTNDDRRHDESNDSVHPADSMIDDRTDEPGWIATLARHRVSRREVLKTVGAGAVFGEAVPGVQKSADGRSDLVGRVLFRSEDRGHVRSYPGSVPTRVSDVGVLGPLHPDFDGDGRPALPYVTTDGVLKLFDGTAIRTVVDGSGSVRPAASETFLTVTTWVGKRSVLFVDAGYETIYRVSPGSVPAPVATPEDGAQAVLGAADIDGDEVAELLFVGRDRRIRSLTPDGSMTEIGPDIVDAIGADRGLGVGPPAELGEGAPVMVPIVTEEGDIGLVGPGNIERRLTTEGSIAVNAPLTPADVDDDGQPEVVFVSTSGEIKYVDDIEGGRRIERLFHRSIRVDRGSGIVGTHTPQVTNRRIPRTLETRLTTPNDARFSAAVALDGATAFVGVPTGMSPETPDTGSVAVFTRRGGTWTLQSTLTPDEGTPGGDFGTAIAVDGTTVLVGAPLPSEPNGSYTGSATVFTRNGGTWRRDAALTSGELSGVDQFGTAVAVDGDTAVVGAPDNTTENGFKTGSVSVFTRTDGTWTKEATLLPESDGIDQFGRAAALQSDVAVVGARRAGRQGLDESGVVFVYRRTGGIWTKEVGLTPGLDNRDDSFGTTLAIDGETLLVGAPTEHTAQGPNAGAVYVFTHSNRGWRRQTSLHNGNTAADHQFGTAVAIDGDTALVGTEFGDGPFVFARSARTWTQRSVLGPDDGGSPQSSNLVALSGAKALVGDDDSGAHSNHSDGSVEVFGP